MLINRIVNLLIIANRRFFLEKEFFWYVYHLLKIVSIDTIKCGRQIFLPFEQENVLVVVEACEILIFIYSFKKRLLLLKKHFDTVMLMSPNFFFLLCHSMVHSVNIHMVLIKGPMMERHILVMQNGGS